MEGRPSRALQNAQAKGDPKREAVLAWHGVTGLAMWSKETNSQTHPFRENRGWALSHVVEALGQEARRHQQRLNFPVGQSSASARTALHVLMKFRERWGPVVCVVHLNILLVLGGFPSGKEPTCRRHKRPKFDPWVGKIPPEKGTVAHSSILAWRIPVTEEPGRLQSMGSQRVGHN